MSLDTAKNIDQKAEELGKKYADRGISSSQIRKMYSSIKKAENEYRFEDNEEEAKRSLTMLKPHLAYAASRNNEMEIFKDEVSKFIDDAVDGGRDLQDFFDLMEAIVAYHNYYEEKGGGR